MNSISVDKVCIPFYFNLHIAAIMFIMAKHRRHDDMERSIRKWVLWISFYNIKFKSIYLPKY